MHPAVWYTTKIDIYIVLKYSEVILITVQRDATQSSLIYYFASSLYMFRESTTSIIRNTQNCKYRIRCYAATSLKRGQLGHVKGRQLHKEYDQYRRLQLQFCILLIMGVFDTRNVQSELQNNKHSALCCTSLDNY